jgi:capsular exopolysaccharide synthesis family protein
MNKNADSTITITDLVNLCMARWRWFIASIVVCLLMAVYYLMTTPYLYLREATVMVLEESLGDNASDNNNRNVFNNIGFVRQKSSVINVMRHITSLDVLMEVARRSQPDVPKEEIINVARDIQSRLSASNAEMGSTIIDLSYKDHSTLESYNILSLVIQVYGERWVEHRLEVTRNTSKFIKERLHLLEQELGIVDDSIAKYKSSFGITDLEHVSDIYLQQQSQSDAEIMRLVSQKEMAGYIRELLEDEHSTNQLLLSNSGINNNGIEAQITMYNNMVLELQGHLKYTSEQNPVIVHLLEQIAGLRAKILTNIINYIHSIDIQLESLIDYNNEATEKVTSNPSQAKYLATIERERTVKESLYMFLLQKMEENEISSTYQTTNIQVIDMPHGGGKPTSPKRVRVLFAGLLFGFLIPTTVIFLRASMDESIRNHRDIECRPAIPFLAEVPMSERIGTISTLQRLFKLKPETKGIVFAEGKQTPINEAFRLIRTKLENATRDQSGINGVYMIASNQENAGKTFVSMNLAMALSIVGNRVLYIDSDLRMASASHRWKTDERGLADHLEGRESDITNMLFHPKDYPTLDVLPAGGIPANPSELLDTPLFSHLIDKVRALYDIVIIDTPPMGKLADAEIVGRNVDRVLFVLRAGIHKRSFLANLESPTEDINGKPRYVILNGVNIDFRYDRIATRRFFGFKNPFKST